MIEIIHGSKEPPDDSSEWNIKASGEDCASK
jgi:hypothetical protein